MFFSFSWDKNLSGSFLADRFGQEPCSEMVFLQRMAAWNPHPERQGWKGFSTTDSARAGADARPSSARGRRLAVLIRKGPRWL